MKHVKYIDAHRVWKVRYWKDIKGFDDYSVLQKCDMKDITRPVLVIMPGTNPFESLWGAVVCGVLYVSTLKRNDISISHEELKSMFDKFGPYKTLEFLEL